jgi:hypothetical protein
MRDIDLGNISRELHKDAAAALVDMSIVGMPGEASVSRRGLSFDATYTPESGGQLEIVQSRHNKPDKVLTIRGVFSGLAAEAADIELIERVTPPGTAPGPYKVEGTLSFAPKEPHKKLPSFMSRLIRREGDISSKEAGETAAVVLSGFRKALKARAV